jgi:hypothetical protein
MRALGGVLVSIILILVVGCAAPPPPKIEGHVSSVSANDIQEIIELVHRDVKRYWNIIPIQRIEIRDHNHVVVYCQDEYNNYIIPVTREHGAWSLPRVTVTG